jgi:hypothetical protein
MTHYGATQRVDEETTRLLDREQAVRSPFEVERAKANDDRMSRLGWLILKLKTREGLTTIAVSALLLLMLYTVNGGFGAITIIQSVVPTYTVYVLRHAEAKYADIQKCDPVQSPKLPDSIGKCGDSWGANRCGGDYLTDDGLERARCIADTVHFEGLHIIMAQYPGTCFDTNVKREYQTVLPLSLKTDIPIDSSLGRGDEWEMATKLTSVDIRHRMCGGGSFTLGGESVAMSAAGADEHGSHGFAPLRWLFGGWGTSGRSPRSIVVAWDHGLMPDLLKYMGCVTDPICTAKLGLLEFDTYYKATYSCVDSELLSMKKLQQNCDGEIKEVSSHKIISS